MKTTLFLGFGGLFLVSGNPTRIQTLKKVCRLHDFLSEICISESTPPTVNKRVSQFRRPLLRRKGAHLNITSHSPTSLQSGTILSNADEQLRRRQGCRLH